MHLSDVIRFYSNPEVIDRIVDFSRGREVIAKYKDSMGKRPDSIRYKNDITQMVRNGATSFHGSIEKWKNPFALGLDMKKKELDSLRDGWDMIIDIDCPHIEYSKLCAFLLCQAIEFHGVKNYSVKFSGGSGFHIGIPSDSFPKELNGIETRFLFPEAPKIIADYLQNMIKEKLSEEILEFEDVKHISKRTGKKFDEIVKAGEFNPYSVLKIDNAALSSRHLMRLPYVFNEKKWLVSIPLKKEEILDFRTSNAEYKNVEVNLGFMDKFKEGEGKRLFVEAFDWKAETDVKKEISKASGKYEIPKNAIPREFYPPCIMKIFKGLEDGKKRAAFILINFLKSTGMKNEEIEKELKEWNSKNETPLRESYLNSQLNWHKKMGKYLPPSCDNEAYYKDIGVCCPDEICKTIKNPVVYPFVKIKRRKKR